jgi:hypothetical protein
MWEFRDQQLHKLQHQLHFQQAISGNSKPWVLREQLLDAVRGAGVADVMNAAMNSAWTPWLPMGGEHGTSGTITRAVHAPPGERVVCLQPHILHRNVSQRAEPPSTGWVTAEASTGGRQAAAHSRLVIWVARLC